ncbi:MAG: TonB-dependent receptor [Nannocystaceae bacterium]
MKDADVRRIGRRMTRWIVHRGVGVALAVGVVGVNPVRASTVSEPEQAPSPAPKREKALDGPIVDAPSPAPDNVPAPASPRPPSPTPAPDLIVEGPTPQAPPDEGLPAEAPPGIPSAATHGLWVGAVNVAGAKEPLPGAQVIPLAGDEPFETDEDGRFERWLLPGTYTFILRAEGFEDLRVTVVVGLGERVELEYRLLEDLDRARYRTTVVDDTEVAVSRTRLVEEEIRGVPGSRGDPFNVIKSLPGANQLAGFLPYVVVRGAAPGNTGYYLDGLRVPMLFHVAAGPSVIHPYFIDAVDFYPSGAPVRLGRFASGIVEGKTRKARSDRVHGEVDVRLTDAGGLFEVPFGRPRLPGCEEERRRDCPRGKPRGSLTVAGRYSYLGGLLSLIPALNARVQFWDFQSRLDVDLGPRMTYRAFAYGSHDLLGQGEAVRTDPDTGEIETYRPDPIVQFRFYRLDQRIIHDLVSGGEARYNVGLGYDRTGFDVNRAGVWRVMPRIQLIKPIREDVQLGVGLDTEFQFHRVGAPIDELSLADPESLSQVLSNRDVSLLALWTDLRWRRGRVELRPGVRVDAYIQNGESGQLAGVKKISRAVGIDPRILTRVRVHPRWVVRQSLGMYHQPPDLPIPLPGIEAFGFERGLQRNVQGTVGYEFEIPGIAVLTQDAYVGRLTNLQDFQLEDAGEGVFEFEDLVRSIDGWTFGLETMLKLDPRRRTFGWIAYTLSRSVRNYAVGGRAPSAWDQTHILNVVLGYRIGRKWSFGGRAHYHTGRPYTPASGFGTSSEDLANNRNSRRLPGFFQFDFRVDRIWTLPDWEVRLFLDVTNATVNTEIIACGGDPDPEDLAAPTSASGSTRLAQCGAAQGIPYIVPGLGIRASF